MRKGLIFDNLGNESRDFYSTADQSKKKILFSFTFRNKNYSSEDDADMGVKRVHGIITTLEGDEVFSDDTESEGEEGQFLEGDFEFDNGGVNNGIMGIDDDGWGFKGFEGTKESASVDLDGIIARHRKKSRKEENSEEEESGEEEDEEEEIDDEDESENVSGESVEDLNEAEAEEWDGFGDDDLGIYCVFI